MLRVAEHTTEQEDLVGHVMLSVNLKASKGKVVFDQLE